MTVTDPDPLFPVNLPAFTSRKTTMWAGGQSRKARFALQDLSCCFAQTAHRL